jgi:hypothetical protein
MRLASQVGTIIVHELASVRNITHGSLLMSWPVPGDRTCGSLLMDWPVLYINPIGHALASHVGTLIVHELASVRDMTHGSLLMDWPAMSEPSLYMNWPVLDGTLAPDQLRL